MINYVDIFFKYIHSAPARLGIKTPDLKLRRLRTERVFHKT